MKPLLKAGYTTYKGVILPGDSANEMRKLERNMRQANSLATYVKHERELIRRFSQQYATIVQAIIDRCENDDTSDAKLEQGPDEQETNNPKHGQTHSVELGNKTRLVSANMPYRCLILLDEPGAKGI